MTDILSNNIVRLALAVLVVGAVAYGINTTIGDDAATTTTANTENVSATVGDETTTTTTEGTTTEVAPTEETSETTAE